MTEETTPIRQCDGCVFWDAKGASPVVTSSGEPLGLVAYCRFNPPAMGRTPWPSTHATDLCSRWKEKPDAQR